MPAIDALKLACRLQMFGDQRQFSSGPGFTLLDSRRPASRVIRSIGFQCDS